MAPSPEFTTSLVRTGPDFAALEPEWARLHAASRPRNAFLSYEWNRACWEHVCPATEPWVLTARKSGRLVGVAPLRRERRFGFRVLRFLGSGWSNYAGFLRDPDCLDAEAALLYALARTPG